MKDLTAAEVILIVKNATNIELQTACEPTATSFSLFENDGPISIFTKNMFIYIQSPKLQQNIDLRIVYLFTDSNRLCLKIPLHESISTLESYLMALSELYRILK